jgi:hypothetical protein
MDINEIARRLGEQTREYLNKRSPKLTLQSGGIKASDGKGKEVFVRYPVVNKLTGRSVKR